MLGPTNEADDNSVAGSPSARGGKSVSFKNHPSDETVNKKRNALLGAAPPAPLLLSRSHTTIELLPILFSPPSPLSRADKSRNGLAVAGGVVTQTALSASNATSSTTTATASRQGGGKPSRKKPKVAKVHVSYLALLWLCFVRGCAATCTLWTFRKWRALLANQQNCH